MKHYSIEYRKALLKEYESSDETVRAFCARNQISTPTFYYWKNELLGKKTKELVEQAPAGLVQVETSVFQKKTYQTPQIMIKKDGMEILIPLNASVEEMRNVFEALGAL